MMQHLLKPSPTRLGGNYRLYTHQSLTRTIDKLIFPAKTLNHLI